MRKKYIRKAAKAPSRKLDPEGYKRYQYQKYVEAYNKKKASLAKRGFEMSDDMYSKQEFEQNRESYVRDLKEQFGYVGNVNQYIVSDQAYYYNAKTGNQLAKALSEATGKKYSRFDVRMENVLSQDDWDAIDAAYHDFKGLTKDEQLKLTGGKKMSAKNYISWYFFGS